MPRFAFAGSVVVLALVFGGSTATAQVGDHLKCYKVKDPLKLKGVVDIDTRQFGLEKECRIDETQLFCVPATKKVRWAFDQNDDRRRRDDRDRNNDRDRWDDRDRGTPIDPLSVFGPPAPGDRVCYRIKCPKPAIKKQVVTDQFGTRKLEWREPDLLCTPAFKGEPPPRECGDTFPQCNGGCPAGTECVNTPIGCDCTPPPPPPCTLTSDPASGPTCSGECPNPGGETCSLVSTSAGIVDCRCLRTDLLCEGQTGAVCNGLCPNATDRCVSDPIRGCVCAPPPPPPCGPEVAPACNAQCPSPDETCTPFTDADGDISCRCLPSDLRCQPQAGGVCGGLCPVAGDRCVADDASGACICAPPERPCSLRTDVNGELVCGGLCPDPNADCIMLPATNLCECVPRHSLCEDQVGTCNGLCPTATDTCVPEDPTDPSSLCKCRPPHCGLDANGQCAGPCPDPTAQCISLPGGTGCTCVTPPVCGLSDTAPGCSGNCPNPADECRIRPGTAGNVCLCVPPGVLCGPTVRVCSNIPTRSCTNDLHCPGGTCPPSQGDCGGLCDPGLDCRLNTTTSPPECECLAPN